MAKSSFVVRISGDRRLVLIDLGDRIVMRIRPANPIEALQGKYEGRGPSSDEARRIARQDGC